MLFVEKRRKSACYIFANQKKSDQATTSARLILCRSYHFCELYTAVELTPLLEAFPLRFWRGCLSLHFILKRSLIYVTSLSFTDGPDACRLSHPSRRCFISESSKPICIKSRFRCINEIRHFQDLILTQNFNSDH